MKMKSNYYGNYSKIYESKLNESLFLVEQNVTVDDIMNPLEGLITEEILGDLIKKGVEKIKGSALGQGVQKAYTNVKTAIQNFFNGVVNFFKNFSFKKLFEAIKNKIKQIGSKVFLKVKQALSSMTQFIIKNNMVDPSTGKPIIKNIWSVLCAKAKSVVNFQEAGVDDKQLAGVGSKIVLKENYSAINEDDKYQISDEEEKYYGVFEKIAFALGIKNARFNGVVSQIMKKGTIGLIIVGLMKAAGFAGIASIGITNPVALAAIGGMLLMAGLIILTIWICKPYPTLEDCLCYLHMFFGGNLQSQNIPVIFYSPGQPESDEKASSEEVDDISKKGKEEKSDEEKATAKPFGSMYPTMIKNLKALQSMLISFDYVKVEGETEKSTKSARQIEPGSVKGFKTQQKVRESHIITSFRDLILEKEFGKQSRNVTIGKDEDYLLQAYNNVKRSIRAIKDEKDKGIGVTSDFIGAILEEKMNAKDVIKDLYMDIYEHLYGKYEKTLPDFGALYKENVQTISKADKRKVVAEKIARLAKRTMQFEGEGFYSGLGEFGADMEEFNTTLKQIMDSAKNEKE